MDFAKLYRMGDAFIHGALRASPRELVDDGAIASAEKLPQQSLEFYHFMGGAPRDLVGTGYAALELFSDRIIQTLRNGGFTGWTTYPIRLYGKRGELIEGYHGFAVTGRCGRINKRKARKVLMPPPCPTGRSYYALIGLYFNPKSWDGSDIFMAKGTAGPIVTEPVMLALTRAKVKNIAFKRLTEYEFAEPVGFPEDND